MNLVVVLRSLPDIVRRYESTFDRVRQVQPTLALHSTIAALLYALSLDSPLPLSDRQELVRALVTLHRSKRHPLWPALLLHTFRPMLLSLRARDRGCREDRDSRILVAFLQALARTPVEGQPVFIALRRATERTVFQGVRAQRVHDQMAYLYTAGDPSVLPHGEPGPFVACLAREMATRLVAAAHYDNQTSAPSAHRCPPRAHPSAQDGVMFEQRHPRPSKSQGFSCS